MELDQSVVKRIIKDYLGNVLHMSLATTANGKPWVCEVHFSLDSELNIYFRSLESRRHSKEIAQNSNVAGTIVEPHGLTDKPRGVYFEGTAELLTNVDEENEAYKAVDARFGLGQALLDEANKTDGHKFYKITVSDFYLFDARESKPSQKYHLSWKN